jgi:hypothetical protein
MSEKFLNKNTPILNNMALDLPFLREVFVDHETSKRADIHRTKNNT